MSELPAPDNIAAAEITAKASGLNEAIAGLTIRDVQSMTFLAPTRVGRDDEGHAHPAPERWVERTLTRVRTSIGVDGYCFGGSAATAAIATQMIAGMDPLAREAIWYKLLRGPAPERHTLDDRDLAVVDCALWDFAGRAHRTAGPQAARRCRDKVPAYASTMCGDDIPGGLDTPEAYAEFAAACKARGYPAFKLHTWMPPLSGPISTAISRPARPCARRSGRRCG